MGNQIIPKDGGLRSALYDALVQTAQYPLWMVKLTDMMHSEWEQGTFTKQKRFAKPKLELKIYSCKLIYLKGELDHPAQVSVLGYYPFDARTNARMVASSAYPNTNSKDWSIRNLKEITEKPNLPLSERLTLVRHADNLPLLGLDIK